MVHSGIKSPTVVVTSCEIESSYRLRTGLRPDGPYDGSYIEDYEYVVGLGHLDEHNGHFGVTSEWPDGIYHYVTTINDVGELIYPYIVGPTYYGISFSAKLNQSFSMLVDVVTYDGVVLELKHSRVMRNRTVWSLQTTTPVFSPTLVTRQVCRLRSALHQPRKHPPRTSRLTRRPQVPGPFPSRSLETPQACLPIRSGPVVWIHPK